MTVSAKGMRRGNVSRMLDKAQLAFRTMSSIAYMQGSMQSASLGD